LRPMIEVVFVYHSRCWRATHGASCVIKSVFVLMAWRKEQYLIG
jgi:hypothetical protein